MSFERILSFFTEHAPGLLLTFVLWWAATAPAATPTPLQSPTPTAAPTATLAPTPTPEASEVVRDITMTELLAASRSDAERQACEAAALGVAVRGVCAEEFAVRRIRSPLGTRLERAHLPYHRMV